jgi:nucleoid-associated protein YgaU
LRSRLPDGTLATSKNGVLVALDDVGSNSDAVGSRADPPFNIPETMVANRSGLDQAAGSVAISQRLGATAATPLAVGRSPSAVLVPKIATAVVSRGDSLWRISRVTYGDGMRYATVYKANRDQIRNPNRIYPGQTFVLPMTAP